MANRDKIIQRFNSKQKTKHRWDDRNVVSHEKKRDRKTQRAIREEKFADIEEE